MSLRNDGIAVAGAGVNVAAWADGEYTYHCDATTIRVARDPGSDSYAISPTSAQVVLANLAANGTPVDMCARGEYIFVAEGGANAGIAVYRFNRATNALTFILSQTDVGAAIPHMAIHCDGQYIVVGTSLGLLVYTFNEATEALTYINTANAAYAFTDVFIRGTEVFGKGANPAIYRYSLATGRLASEVVIDTLPLFPNDVCYDGTNLWFTSAFGGNGVVVGSWDGSTYTELDIAPRLGAQQYQYLYPSGRYVFVACGDDGVRQLRYQNERIVQMDTHDNGAGYTRLHVLGERVVAPRTGAVDVLRVTDTNVLFEAVGQDNGGAAEHICTDGTYIYGSLFGGGWQGINAYDLNMNHITFRNDGAAAYGACAATSDGVIYVGRTNMLSAYSFDGATFGLLDSELMTIVRLRASDEICFALTATRVYSCRYQTGNISVLDAAVIPGGGAQDLAVDGDHVFVVTATHVYAFERNGTSFGRMADSMTINYVLGRIWVQNGYIYVHDTGATGLRISLYDWQDNGFNALASCEVGSTSGAALYGDGYYVYWGTPQMMYCIKYEDNVLKIEGGIDVVTGALTVHEGAATGGNVFVAADADSFRKYTPVYADHKMSPATGFGGATVQFTPKAVLPATTEWEWDLGDGTYQDGRVATRTYPDGIRDYDTSLMVEYGGAFQDGWDVFRMGGALFSMSAVTGQIPLRVDYTDRTVIY